MEQYSGYGQDHSQESDDAFWFGQPDDYIFYDDRGRKIYQE